MIKKHIFNISPIYIDKFFTPVRKKTDIIKILMESIRYISLKPEVSDEDSLGTITIFIGKMSRIFFLKEEKIFSINFPFYIMEEDGLLFKYKDIINIDGQVISNVISTLKCKEFDSHCSLEFVEPITDYEEINNSFWVFFKDLLLMESGYIRYDYDIETYNKFKEENREHEHPLNHFDIFYSSNTTFKIGLRNKLNVEDFIDILDLKTNCKYIS